jgi:hypothetical protein
MALTAGLVLLLLLVWFLSQHLTVSTGRATTSPRQSSAPAATFPRTGAGAVDAATFYLTTIDGPMLLEPDRLAEFERRAGSGAYAEQLVKNSQDVAAQMEATYGLRAARERGLTVALQPQPLAYKVTSEWNGWSTSIAIWWIELVATDSVSSTVAGWQTTTLSVVWEGGGWRISNAESSEGPGPGGDNTQLPEQLHGYQRFRFVV